MFQKSSEVDHYIYRTYYTNKNGIKVYAKDYGLKAWRFLVK